MITMESLPESLRRDVIEHGIDLDVINEWIENYNPVVSKVDIGDDGVSVLVEDSNDDRTYFWIDYYLYRGTLESDWNKTQFNTFWTGEVVELLFRRDHSVWERSDDVAFEYLFDHGIIKDTDTGFTLDTGHYSYGTHSASALIPAKSKPAKSTKSTRRAGKTVKGEMKTNSTVKTKAAAQPKAKKPSKAQGITKTTKSKNRPPVGKLFRRNY